jgi:uncharacterized protein YndB with AHSA1/START domain/uncharacterized damage-inducible protein DinB
MTEERQVKHKVVVEATPELVFEALTKASELREWFSDQAWTQDRLGGRYEVRWNQGYRGEGTFAELDPPRRAAVTWQGSGEPGQTLVEFGLEEAEGGVEVTVVHSGFGPGQEWDEAVAQAERGWSVGFENLKSTLETGVDLRIARRPFLGIIYDLVDSERAAKEGIAVEEGIYITDTVEGGGAKAAGLTHGDVIVSLGGAETPGAQEMDDALNAHQAGDVVDVELVRGQEQKTIQLTLGQRPQPDVPETTGELVERVAEVYAETGAELKAAVAGLDEQTAGQNPSAGEWSVKDVLAHLSLSERGFLHYLTSVALDGWQDGGDGNPTAMPARVAAVQAITPTVDGLLDRIHDDERETVAFLRGLPEETLAHKARFRRLAEATLYLSYHTHEHVEQIEGILAAVRGD